MGFYNYYNDQDSHALYEISMNSFNTLMEVHKRLLMSRTDLGRIKRARNDIRISPNNIKESTMKDGNDLIEYDFRANPSVSMSNSWGYIIYKRNDVKQLLCSCHDFFYRLYEPLVKSGVATFTPPPKYANRIKKMIGVHTQNPTNITNPEGKLYVCKHLYAMLLEYVGVYKTPPLKGVKISKDVKDKLKQKSDITTHGDKSTPTKHISPDDVTDKDIVDVEIASNKDKENKKVDKEEDEEEDEI